MITCIVGRRLGQGRKAQGPRLIVPDTTSPVFPEFQNYSPEENVLSSRRLSLAYEGYGGCGAFSQQPGMFSLQGITVDGRPTLLDDGEEKYKITAPTQRPSRGEKALSKHFVAPNARRNRRASLHGCDFRSPHGFSTIDSGYDFSSKTFTQSSLVRTTMQENLTANDLECDSRCYFLLLVKEDCGILNQESRTSVPSVSDIHYFLLVVADAVLHPKEVLYLQKIALASNEETRRKNLSSGMAHISLDGRIMNAVSATSSATIGGNLGEEEARAWDCFAPLQRVLIVAVAAAAEASSKHKNHKEINRLQKAVHAQVRWAYDNLT